MGLRSEWVKAKAEAKKLNGKKNVPLKSKNLGAALDVFEAADKAHDKATYPGRAWAKATDAWVKAADKANKIVAAYVLALPATDAAEDELKNHRSFSIYGKHLKAPLSLNPRQQKHLQDELAK